MPRSKKGLDPFKTFCRNRWNNINTRTINGSNPNYKCKKIAFYLKRGTEIRMTREEFNTWCESQRNIIMDLRMKGKIPSLDRIDSYGHYEISNLRVIDFNLNRAGAGQIKHLNFMKKLASLPLRYCALCNKQLIRKKVPNGYEDAREFIARETCGRSCAMKLRYKRLRGDTAMTPEQKQLVRTYITARALSWVTENEDLLADEIQQKYGFRPDTMTTEETQQDTTQGQQNDGEKLP